MTTDTLGGTTFEKGYKIDALRVVVNVNLLVGSWTVAAAGFISKIKSIVSYGVSTLLATQ
jgi:hypothetical protein